MFSLGRILSSHQILNFAFPHIWSFTNQALFPCDYIYISDPGINFLCFIKTWCVVLLIYHFYNSLFPAGSRLRWWHCYDLWWGSLTENVCSFWFSFFSTPGSYFPNSSLCHFKHYLPFAEMYQFIWWRCVRKKMDFYRGLWFFLVSTQCWFFFFTFSYVVSNLEFIFISHLFLLICHQRKCRLAGKIPREGVWIPVTHSVGDHLPSYLGALFIACEGSAPSKSQS